MFAKIKIVVNIDKSWIGRIWLVISSSYVERFSPS